MTSFIGSSIQVYIYSRFINKLHLVAHDELCWLYTLLVVVYRFSKHTFQIPQQASLDYHDELCWLCTGVQIPQCSGFNSLGCT
jgi:hypothetical protein